LFRANILLRTTASRERLDAPRERIAMSTAESIRKFGFKRWYERTLIESHAYLVTCFLGMITTFAGLQLVADHNSVTQSLLGFVASAFGVVLVVIGLRRYTLLLALAEDWANAPPVRNAKPMRRSRSRRPARPPTMMHGIGSW